MKSRTLRSFTAASLLATVAIAAWAAHTDQDQPRREPGQREPGERGPGERGPGERGQLGVQQPIEGAMKAMNRALRGLKDQITDAAKREENLRLISQMQAGCIAAKGGRIEDVLKDVKDDAERASKSRKYREDMIALARTLLDVEEGLLREKYADAQNALNRALQLQEAGHKAFGVD